MDIPGIFQSTFSIVKVMSKYFENKPVDELVTEVKLSIREAIYLQEIDVL